MTSALSVTKCQEIASTAPNRYVMHMHVENYKRGSHQRLIRGTSMLHHGSKQDKKAMAFLESPMNCEITEYPLSP